ncbi:MAG: carbohydrate binding family 9 domain-containing protein [Sphingobacteriales bacterium]|nr:carbohydrate binding family 9 domain-containing protein [Sphingobacteriales bacterium]
MKNYICLPLLLISVSLYSQPKSIQAVKTEQAPKIDGNLDDATWTTAAVLDGFIQNFPTYGLPVSQKTEVKILYDNSAIYVGAYLYDDPVQVRKQITARDDEGQKDVDFFSVFFDTYNDHQNGFQFLVTTANVQSDSKPGPGYDGVFGNFGDKTWDAVWESSVKMQADGWSVEMKIPYSSLRFAKKEVQNWGLQLLRYNRRFSEFSFWNPVDPKVNGFVNQFGQLNELKNIQPPLRLSFSPYITTGFRSSPQTNGYLDEWLRNGGMDVKYGLNESFTLDATLIPDFGQVVSDNVINNLTPYEVKFTENRQFFTEGTELFNKAGLFYSKRVGATPSKYRSVKDFVANNSDWEIIKNPSVTQLYNGTKFSGRTKKKLGIGIFNALAAPMEAKLRNIITGKDSVIRTEEITNYNIFVLDQALKGRSYVTFTNTNVLRNGNGRDANVTAIDVALYNKRNSHSFKGTARYSKIWNANGYDGYNTTLSYGKVSGNWQYSFSGNIESKKYDPNDLGILTAPNEITYRGNLTYRIFKPTDKFITYSYTIGSRLQYLYKPYTFNRFDITANAFWVFRNFWDVNFKVQIIPGWERNYFALFTEGKHLSYPVNYYFQVDGSTDSRKKLFVRYSGVYAVAPKYDNTLTGTGLGFRFRFSNKFSLDLQTNSAFEKNQLGYAFIREPNGDPIVGFRNNREFTSVLSGIYNFNSRLNLTLRARHYWNEVKYKSFHDVDAKGYLVARPFIPDRDENFNIFNLDAFLTWDFRLGSKLIIGYKNWLGDEETVPFLNKNSYLHNLGEVFDLRHGNEITIRFIYFLDYNQLRKKH